MQDHMNDWSHIQDRPLRKKLPTGTALLGFLLPRLGVALLIAATTAALVPQLANKQKTHANSRQGQSTTGQVTLTLDPGKQLTITKARISGSPRNVILEMHIHTDSCKGPKLFIARTPSNNAGNASIKNQKFDPLGGTIVPNKLSNNWWFNVYDTTRRDPADNNKFLSLACGPIQVVATDGLAVFPHAAMPNNPVSFVSALEYLAHYLKSLCEKEGTAIPECRNNVCLAVTGGCGELPPSAVPNTGPAVTAEGTIQRTGVTTYMYGSHQLVGSGNTFYALRSSKLDLDQYIGRTVKITGTPVPGYPVDGGPPYLDVQNVENSS